MSDAQLGIAKLAEAAKNPKMLADAMEMLKDPEVAAEVFFLYIHIYKFIITIIFINLFFFNFYKYACNINNIFLNCFQFILSIVF
jgi:hypothetical protein